MSTWQEQCEAVQHAVRGKRPNRKGWVRTNCPLCEARVGRHDRHQSFGFHVVRLRWECYRCGSTGKLRDSMVDEAWQSAVIDEDAASQPVVAPPEHFYALADGQPGARALCLADARDYVASRGITGVKLARSGIGACALGRYAGRIVIPVTAPDGAWLWYVGRSWVQKPADPSYRKYLYPMGGRSGVLYNHAALLVPNPDEPVLPVEGCLDALHVGEAGVGVLGTPSISNDTLMAALLASPRPVAMCLDGDAHEKGWALAMALRLHGKRAGNIRLPPTLDPDELPVDVLLHAARACLDAPGGEVCLLSVRVVPSAAQAHNPTPPTRNRTTP